MVRELLFEHRTASPNFHEISGIRVRHQHSLGHLSAKPIERAGRLLRRLALIGGALVGAVQLVAAQSPPVSLAQPNDQRQLDGCATCASFTTGYATPTFGFSGGSVGTGLYYSMELARPTGYVEVNVKFPGVQIPMRLRIRLSTYPSTAWQTLTTGASAAFVRDTTSLRVAAQLADSTLATGVHLRQVEVTAFYGDSSATTSSATPCSLKTCDSSCRANPRAPKVVAGPS